MLKVLLHSDLQYFGNSIRNFVFGNCIWKKKAISSFLMLSNVIYKYD